MNEKNGVLRTGPSCKCALKAVFQCRMTIDKVSLLGTALQLSYGWVPIVLACNAMHVHACNQKTADRRRTIRCQCMLSALNRHTHARTPRARAREHRARVWRGENRLSRKSIPRRARFLPIIPCATFLIDSSARSYTIIGKANNCCARRLLPLSTVTGYRLPVSYC